MSDKYPSNTQTRTLNQAAFELGRVRGATSNTTDNILIAAAELAGWDHDLFLLNTADTVRILASYDRGKSITEGLIRLTR